MSLPQLTPEQLLQINSHFNSQEVLQAIDTLPLNKSPGLDGYNREYYKTFKQVLSSYLVNIYNAAAASSPPLQKC